MDVETLSTAFEVAFAFAEAPKGWPVLAGAHGSGKTHLAAAIANMCIEGGRPVFFVGVSDLLDHLRASYAPTSDIGYSDLFQQVKEAPLLVLDGLGGQSATPWAEEKLYQLLVHRHNARLPTVITVDSGVELKPALSSRLKDMRFVVPIEIEVPDYRDQTARPPARSRRAPSR